MDAYYEPEVIAQAPFREMHPEPNHERGGNMYFTEFVYDDSRCYSKLYVFFKYIGFVIYSSTLTRCVSSSASFFSAMIGVMFVSTLNSARYEFQHYSRYGSVFASVDEYKTWKMSLWPASRVAFSVVELGIKMWYFVTSFPPEFEYQNACDVGTSLFNIHIILLLLTYIIVGSCSMCILSMAFCYGTGMHQTRSRHIFRVNGEVGAARVSIVPRAAAGVAGTAGVIELAADTVINEECCICMDTENTQQWVLLPCAHKFHGSCISKWRITHDTCPLCRNDLV